MSTIGVFAYINQDDKVLCVKQNYPPFTWTLPGGKLEPGESPINAIIREVYEETKYKIKIINFIGTYVSVYKDDLVLLFRGEVEGQDSWESNEEISAIGFFDHNFLPLPMGYKAQQRIKDAALGKTSHLSMFIKNDDRSKDINL